MNERQIREIAETAFRHHFGDVKIDDVNVKKGFDHDGDPVVDVTLLIYDGEYEKLNGAGLLRVQSDIVSKAWREVEDDLGFPCVHFLPISSLGRCDPATDEETGQ